MKWKFFIVLFEKIEFLKQNYRITDFSDFCLFALFLRYFSLFDMQIMKVSTSYVHNDLSKKAI